MIRALLALIPAGNRGLIVAHLTLTVCSAAVRAASAVLLVPLVAALFSDDPERAWAPVGWLALAVVASWLIDWFVARLAFQLGFAVLDHAQMSLAHRLQSIRLTWFDGENTGTARQAVSAVGPELVGLFVYLATPMLSGILLPIAIAIALMPISVWLGCAAAAGVPVLLGAYWLSTRLSRAADRAANEANGALSERILEFARTQQALRAARRVAPEQSLVGDALQQQHGATMRQIPGQLIFSFASQLALIVFAGAVVWLSVAGELSAPQAIALIVVIARYLEPFTALAGLAAATESSLAILRRIRSVLDAPTVGEGTRGVQSSAPPSLALLDVSMHYGDDSQQVLEGLSLSFASGTTTAIVGPSGSGKSTILALLAGLHEPTSGAITIDGDDASELTAAARRKLVSVVFQESYLFDTDIRTNIRIGDPDADDAKFDEVTQLARVNSIVPRLSAGWNTRVGEAGRALSGGERQRVSIARALLKAAPILLVDEATSALDTENEVAVAAALRDDTTARTRIIVAHRLSSIRSADRIVFLDAGRIIEDGTFDELVASGGRFAEFYRRQHDAARWRL